MGINIYSLFVIYTTDSKKRKEENELLLHVWISTNIFI